MLDFRKGQRWSSLLLVITLLAVLSLSLGGYAAAQDEGPFDLSALSQPDAEIRDIVPYGKSDAQFGTITALPEGIRIPASTPLQVRLRATKVPRLNEAINVVLQVHAFEDAPGTVAEIQLPEGAQVLNGATRSEFNLVAGQRVELRAVVVPTVLGEQAIHGVAFRTVSEEMTWGDMDSLYMTIGSEASTLGFESSGQRLLGAGKASDLSQPPLELKAPVAEGEEQPLQEEIVEDGAPLEPGDDPGDLDATVPPSAEHNKEVLDQNSPAALVTIAICWILGSDRDGSTPPLRDALIQLYDDDAGADDLLNSSYTGYANGCRTVTLDNADIDEGGTIDVYWRVFLYRVGRYRVQTYGGAVFFCQSSVTNNVIANVNYGTWWCGGGAGNDRSVRLFNDVYRLRRFVMEQATNGGMGGDPGQVTVRWETAGADGTYYSLLDGLVHLADGDAASRDVVVHEASHRYMHVVYGGWPPNDCPSPHFLNGVSGRYCAWSEGYTYIHTAAADGNPIYTFSSGATLNLETPNCNSAGWADGPMVEGRVGGVLIDLLDPFALSFGSVAGFANEGVACSGDDQAMGMYDSFWDLFFDQNDNLIVAQGGDNDSFSNAWEARQYPRYAPERIGNLNSINTFMQD